MSKFSKEFWEREWKEAPFTLSTMQGYSFLDLNSERVLEVGCGDLNYSPLPDSISFFVGCDISFTALKGARLIKRDVNLVEANAINLPFKDDSFDEIISIETMALLGNDFYKALKEMRRVTKNKITLYLSHKDIALELSKDKYSDLEFYSLFHESYGDIVVFTEKNIENLLINLNLKLKKLKIINEKGIKCRILLTAEK